jgi:hypothetical protein
MSTEQKEPWINQMALATVILAVCATLSTFKGGGFSTQSVINQSLASDQWAFYQAKSTKQQLNELQAEHLRLESMSLAPGGAPAEAYAKKIAEYEQKAARYDAEKKKIETDAHQLEKQRDEAKAHGRPFGIAVIFLQVAVLLNSIAGLLKAKRIWWTSIPVGLTGLTFFADGFFTFM